MQRRKTGVAVVTFLSVLSPFKSFCRFHSPFNHVLVSSAISHKPLDLGCVSHSGITLMEWLSSQNRRNQHVGDQHVCFVSTFNIYKCQWTKSKLKTTCHETDLMPAIITSYRSKLFSSRITALCEIYVSDSNVSTLYFENV